MEKPKVGLPRRGSRRDNIFGAMDLVREDIVPKVRPQVLLKPNFLSKKNQLASSHTDAMRGAIDFLLSCPDPPTEILIAEGGNEDYSGESFENFAYQALVDEYEVEIRLIDLHQETDWETIPIYLAESRTSYKPSNPTKRTNFSCSGRTIRPSATSTSDLW